MPNRREGVLKALLLSLGYRVEAPATFVGKSGVLHNFALCAEKGEGKRIAIDVVGSEKPSVVSIIALRAKAIDTGLNQLLLVTDAPTTEEARRLASSYNMRIVLFETSRELRRELSDFLGSEPPAPSQGAAS